MPRSRLLLAALALVTGTLAGCDSAAVGGADAAGAREARFGGLLNAAEGPGASLAVDAGGLLRLDAPAGGALRVETRGAARADIYFDLSGLGAGDEFAAEVVGPAGRPVARLVQRPAGGAYEVSGEWPAGVPATLEAVDRGRVVYTAPLAAGGAPLGTTSDVATSKHYDDKGRIVYDFEGGSAAESGGATRYLPPGQTGAPRRVTHLRVVLPEGALGAVAAVRLETPPGATLSVRRQEVTGPR